MIELRVNGTRHQLEIDPQMSLLWALREHVGITGTKYGCGIGQCGACTVHLNGAAIRSGSLPVSAAVGQEVTTIEGLGTGPMAEVGRAVQQTWPELKVVQCGFCQSEQIMQASALLAANPAPDVGCKLGAKAC
ncbi:MAG: 2Fe-2S iron-sulfur cluster-binding protein [Thiohalocapsa sp.]